MGDENVPLADVATENPTVIERYGEWIEAFVKEYNIDGLRIDGKRSFRNQTTRRALTE